MIERCNSATVKTPLTRREYKQIANYLEKYQEIKTEHAKLKKKYFPSRRVCPMIKTLVQGQEGKDVTLVVRVPKEEI